MNQSSHINLFSTGDISSSLLKLSIPVIIGMLISALYNVIDAIFVGGLGTQAIGAVSITFPISMLLIGIGLTFGSGAASYISRLLGKNEKILANKTASIAFYSSFFIGTIVIITILIFLTPTLKIFGATKTILPYAKEFSSIFIAGSILSIVNVTMNNLAISEGASKISMTAMILGAVINIILEPLLIYHFYLGISGAAIANVIAQGITTLVYIWYFNISHKSFLNINIKLFSLDKKIFKEILKLGIPLFLYQLLTSISIGLTNSSASIFGDAAVAAMGIITRIFALVTYVIFGYSKGFQPFAGFNYGAKNFARLKSAIDISLKWTTIFCGISAAIIIIFSIPIMKCFSSDISVINIGQQALIANSLIFITFGFQTIYISLFLALGKAKEGSILSLSRQGIFFIPTILILPTIIGLHGVIYSQLIADILTTVLTIILAKHLRSQFHLNIAT